jgi:hypothetical protein
MISPVSSATQSQSADQAQAGQNKKPVKPDTTPPRPDSVQLSTAALSALKESPEGSSH